MAGLAELAVNVFFFKLAERHWFDQIIPDGANAAIAQAARSALCCVCKQQYRQARVMSF